MGPAIASIYEVHIRIARAVATIICSTIGCLITSSRSASITKVRVRSYSKRIATCCCSIACSSIVFIICAVVETQSI